MSSLLRPPVFVGAKDFLTFKNHLKPKHFVADLPRKGNFVLGINVDTEFQTQSNDDIFNPDMHAQARRIVTLQISDLLNQHPLILAHTDQVQYAKDTGRDHLIRHPVATADFVIADYLRQQGFNIQLIYDPRAVQSKRTMTAVLCAFFLNADLYPCFKGKCLRRVERFIQDKKVAHQKHFRQLVQPGQKGCGKLRLPYYIVIDGQKFGLALDFLDLLAAQGKVSFKDFCQNVELSMDSKDLAGANISRMADWYFENPRDYDRYATGDLCVYTAWSRYVEQINHLIKKIVGPDYVQDPALTIGSTTNRILNAFRLQYLGLPLEEQQGDLFKRLLATTFFERLDDENNPAHTQLKVDGGRCRNNHPTLSLLTGALCDLDYKGAYTSAMMYLLTFFGTPSLEVFDNMSLQKVYKKYKSRLKPYHWTMRITTTEDLSFDQDMIASFFNYRWKDRKCDSESYGETGELDYDSGTSKIFSRKILNGMLTSDILDVILHTWSAKAQDDFFKKCRVDSLLFYDPCHEVKDVDTFVDLIRNEDPLKPSKAWHAAPLKIMGIEMFREERLKHAKGTSQNAMFKLVGNTAYGAMVSHFFQAQNPVVANNITAHIRVAVYLAEKALGIKQTITDGGIFNLNEVLTNNRKDKIYTDKLFFDLCLSKRELNHQLHSKRTGLGGHLWDIMGNCPDNLQVFCDHVELPLKEAEVLVNQLCLKHVQQTFPTMPLLQNPDLEFEMKVFYNGATFHGASNYAFWQGEHQATTKMRGYERKHHDGFTLSEDGMLIQDPIYSDQMSPAQWIHQQLYNNDHDVPLPTSFIKNVILKTGDFVNHYDLRPDSPIKPGDNLKKMGCPKLASLNQFTFQTMAQFQHWTKITQQLLRKYHLSLELFFVDHNNQVMFHKMIDVLHNLISRGLGCTDKDEILAHFDPHHNLSRMYHRNGTLVQYKTAREVMQDKLATFYNCSEEDVLLQVDDLEYLDEVDEFDLK